MPARVLSGTAVAARVRAQVREQVAAHVAGGARPPALAVVLVGDDPASRVYVAGKRKACAEVGIRTLDHPLPADTPEDALIALVRRLDDDPEVDGVLVQLPLPRGVGAERVLDAIDPDKDVDGLHPENLGLLWQARPRFVACTPAGVLRLLEEAGTLVDGADVVLVGRSAIVGKPLAALFALSNATVQLCHRHTVDLPGKVARADIVVAAAGSPALVRGAWIKPGATVIDVGINRVDGKLVGDVEFAAAAERAGAITPVPGGVGPMTIAMLCANTLAAARRRAAAR